MNSPDKAPDEMFSGIRDFHDDFVNQEVHLIENLAEVQKTEGGPQEAEREPRPRFTAGRPWTVVIFSHNRPEQLADLLRALEREMDSGVRIDVRVYDNASESDLTEPLYIIERRGWRLCGTKYYHG